MDMSFLKVGRDFRSLLDIGANNGAYGDHLRKFFEIETVVAIEPLPNRRPELEALGFEVHSVAASDTNTTAKFRVNNYDAASSLLPLTKRTRTEWPEASESSEIDVEVVRLDDRLAGRNFGRDLLIKVDAQGLEPKIIRGAPQVFAQASVILIETIFVSLYEGDGTFNAIHAPLAELGFQLTGFRNQNVSKTDGRPLFAHCIYERS